MHELRDVYVSTHRHTNNDFLKFSVADEGSSGVICAKPTVKSGGKDTKPLCEAVHTVCTAVLQQWEGQDAPSPLTTSLEQELFDGSGYHITCHLL